MISKETAEHYAWGQNCDGWHLVDSVELSVIHSCLIIRFSNSEPHQSK